MRHGGSTTDAGTWSRIQNHLQERSSAASYTNWIAPLRFLGLSRGCLRLAAPNPGVQAWVRAEVADRILSAAADLSLPVSFVDVEVEDPDPEQPAVPPLPQHRRIRRSAAADTLWNPKQADTGDIGFLHSFLAQVGLPRKRVTNLDGSPALWYERRSGNCALLVQAGKIDNGKEFVLQPIPYGPKPRLMLMDICTRSVQTRSPEVDLEPSVRQYLTKRLSVGWGGGRNGQYTLFRKQSLALAACSMRLAVEQGQRVVQFQGMPIAKFEAWIENEDAQQPLWPGKLSLSAEFYGSLIDHGLPVDMRAYHALSHSALAMDLYTFLAHRMWRIDGSIEIGWEQMRDAMAPEYAEIRVFRRHFLKALAAVQEVYPEAKGRVHPIRGRVRIYQGNPPVEPKSPRPSGKRPKGPIVDI